MAMYDEMYGKGDITFNTDQFTTEATDTNGDSAILVGTFSIHNGCLAGGKWSTGEDGIQDISTNC